MSRADRRTHHIIIKTTCKKTGRNFTSAHSTDDMDDGHLGSGAKLWRSIERHGKETHTSEIIERHATRKELVERKKELDEEFNALVPIEKVEQKVTRAYRVIDRKHHLIYKTTCAITGKYYIGLHSTDNLNDGYQGSGIHVQRSLKKYGKDNHTTEIVESLPDRASLIIREAELVNEQRLQDERCMNLMLGGSAPLYDKAKMTEQARAKISSVAKEMWSRRKADPVALADHVSKLNKPEHVVKRAEANKAKGHKRSPEQLARLAAGQGKYYSEVPSDVLIARGQKAAESRAKTWIIEDKDGNQQTVKDIVKFSEANGIYKTALYKTEKSGTYRAGFRIIGRA